MKRIFLLMFLIPGLALAQTQQNIMQDSLKKPDLTLEKKLKEEIKAAPIKVKKNIYFGIKVKRAYTVNEVRGKRIIEEFNILKEPTRVDKYVQNIYIHDRERNRVRAVKPSSQPMMMVLHGPYQKIREGIVIEEGMFFYGTKHQRWLVKDDQEKLLSKEHYHKGWYRDSDISYYDSDKKSRLREVVPIQYGKKEGPYYQFFNNGKIAVKGQYQFDKRIGIWEEYYDAARTTIKREIQYPKDAFDKSAPYIRKEWDSRGNSIYTSPKIKSGR